MRPSPIRAENQRWARVSSASSSASPAASPAMPTTSAGVAACRMPSSMMTLQQQRHGHRDHRVERDDDQEQGQRAAVGPGVGGDPADGARLEPLAGDRAVAGERPHRLPAAASTYSRATRLAPADLPRFRSGRNARHAGGGLASRGAAAACAARCARPRPAPRACCPRPGQQRLGRPRGRGVGGQQRGGQVADGVVQLGWPGTTSSASRSTAASAAATVRAVRQSSSARGRPTRSTSGLVPVRSGTSPSAGSLMQSLASSARTRRSQASASWKPAPMAWPCTAAIETMAGSRSQQVARLVAGDPVLEAGLGRRSAPGPRPGRPRPRTSAGRFRRRTMARRRAPRPPGPARAGWRRSSARPCHMRGVIALRRSGRLSVTVATAPLMSRLSPRSPVSGTRPHCSHHHCVHYPGRAATGLSLTALITSACGARCPATGDGSALCLGLAPGGTAAAAQRHAVLGQDAVNEAVRPAGRAASERMLSPALYLFLRSDASLARSAPVTRVPFLRVSVTRSSR